MNEMIERLNHRDGTKFILLVEDGTPTCPHCGNKMVKVEGRWENAMCSCWWKGMQDANYYAQVVVSDTAQDEFNYRAQCAEEAAKVKADSEDTLMKARLAYAASDAAAKFQIIHNLLYLFGKRNKSKRNRVRAVIADGGDFDQARNA